jgi:hypothetical protein
MSGRRRGSLDMSDAPVEALNFFENPSIDTDKETFEDEAYEESSSPPNIDVQKETFEVSDGGSPRERGSNPRQNLFVLLEEPDSSALARVISVVLMLMIFASSVSFVIETTDPVQSDPPLRKKLNVRLLHLAFAPPVAPLLR